MIFYLKKLADAKKSLYICKSICIPVNCIIALRSCNLSFRGTNQPLLLIEAGADLFLSGRNLSIS